MEEQSYQRWNGNSQNAQLLQSLLRSKAIPANWGALKVQQQYPQFAIYRTENFTVNLSRYRKKFEDQEKARNNGREVVPRSAAPVVSSQHTPQEYAENFLPQPRKI
jgi:hypothetical protein